LARGATSIVKEKKDPTMKNQRSFSPDFKPQVVEELLSGNNSPAQLCHRYNTTSSVVHHWKKQHSLGKSKNEPIAEGALNDRIKKLVRLVDKLTLENEFLKRGLQHNLSQYQHSALCTGSNGL